MIPTAVGNREGGEGLPSRQGTFPKRLEPIPMTASFLVPILALFTLLAVTVLGIVGKFETERRRKDPNDPASSLAADGDSHRRDATS